MKSFKLMIVVALFLAPIVAVAQDNPSSGPPDTRQGTPDPLVAQQQSAPVPSPTPVPFPTPVPPPPPGKPMVMVRTSGRVGGVVGPVRYEPLVGGEFGPGGAWWKNSEIVSKVQLSEEQGRKISQTFLDHKLKLIDLQADLDKQELRLQPLLDVDQPDQSKVGVQIDSITSARGRLEKENAMMMLDIRRWLSVEQWKKLKSLEAADPGPRNVFYFRGNAGPGGPEFEGKQKMFFRQNLGPQDGPGSNFDGPPPPPLPEDTPVTKSIVRPPSR